jgi:hypothetical protein
MEASTRSEFLIININFDKSNIRRSQSFLNLEIK